MHEFTIGSNSAQSDAVLEVTENPEQALMELEDAHTPVVPVAVAIAAGSAFTGGLGTGVALYGVTR